MKDQMETNTFQAEIPQNELQAEQAQRAAAGLSSQHF